MSAARPARGRQASLAQPRSGPRDRPDRSATQRHSARLTEGKAPFTHQGRIQRGWSGGSVYPHPDFGERQNPEGGKTDTP